MGDQTNPFTMMGMMQMMQPNKYVDPKYKNKPLSLPGFYGEPTDAAGNPIGSFQAKQAEHDAWTAAHPEPVQGTTLNTPQPGYPSLATMDTGQRTNALAGLQPSGQPYATTPGGSFGGDALLNRQFAAFGSNPLQPQQAAATTAAPVQTNPVDMRQAYLDALSRPQGGGRMITPGATVPEAKPLGQPSVVDAFMATHGGGGPAPAGGGYSNQGFFDTLNRLQGGSQVAGGNRIPSDIGAALSGFPPRGA